MPIPPYSQWVAMKAVFVASWKAYIKNPSAIIFTIGFPLIFIVLLGSQQVEGGRAAQVAFLKKSDTANMLYSQILSTSFMRVRKFSSDTEAMSSLQEGNLTAIFSIMPKQDEKGIHKTTSFVLQVISNTISQANGTLSYVEQSLGQFIRQVDYTLQPSRPSSLTEKLPTQIVEARKFKPIDFILPGQLGFSLISTGIFGVAFSFFFLRKTQVLKRMFATPIKKQFILIGEGMSRFSFQLITACLIIGVGYFFYDFTLYNGTETIINMLLLCILGLFVFMGIGFMVSNVSTNEQMISGVANLVAIPQFLLSGSFFSTQFFPQWLQWVAKGLPLTHLNNALREVAFQGHSLWDVREEVLILSLFALGLYFLNVRFLKWED